MIHLHVNKNRIVSNLKTERENLDRPLKPVVRLEDSGETFYGTSADIICRGCGSRAASLVSKWDGGRRLSCGATVYIEADPSDVTIRLLNSS